jgi:hypothetical protein
MANNSVPVSKAIQQNNTRGLDLYRYPISPSDHNIVFIFKDYDYNSSQTGFVKGASENSVGSVTLPIPTNLVDNYSVKVGPYELGLAGALAVDALTGNASGIGDDIVSAFRSASQGNYNNIDTDTLTSALSTAKQFGAFVGRNALESIPGGGGIAAGIDIAGGTAINPHVALKFDGVDLKQHTFNWQLSPRNEDEAQSIRRIIKFIKSSMLPDYQTSGESALSRSLLKYPRMVDIFFTSTGLNQDYFYYFKPAMINTFTTDYTPQGLALNRGGRPAFINLTMTVTEAQIHTRKDIDGGDENSPNNQGGF